MESKILIVGNTRSLGEDISSEHHHILYDLQHGFRSKRSTETQLISYTQDIKKTLKTGNQTDAIIMDFSKAFDKSFSLETGHQTEKLWNHWITEQMGRGFSLSAVSEQIKLFKRGSYQQTAKTPDDRASGTNQDCSGSCVAKQCSF